MSPFLSDCPSLMLAIAIHCIQHSQAMLERGVCELAHSFFHISMLMFREKLDQVYITFEQMAKLCIYVSKILFNTVGYLSVQMFNANLYQGTTTYT